MANYDDSLQIVKLFLKDFYFKEPNNIIAATKAVKDMVGRFNYEWRVACAFRDILQISFPPNILRKEIGEASNRYFNDDEEARQFLQVVYEDIGLDAAVNFDNSED
jgi:hypothetical protein